MSAVNSNKGKLGDPGLQKPSSGVLQHLTQRRHSRFMGSCMVEAGENILCQEDNELAQKVMNPRQLEVLAEEPRKGPAAPDGAWSVGDACNSVPRLRSAANRDGWHMEKSVCHGMRKQQVLAPNLYSVRIFPGNSVLT